MADRMRTQFEVDTLPRFIEIQRWYTTKGTAIRRARLAEHAIWETPASSWLLATMDLEGPAEESTYFLPLAIAWETTEEERLQRLSPTALARIRQQANVGVMADAFHDDAFCRAVVQAMGAGQEIQSSSGRLRFSATSAFPQAPSNIAGLPVSHPSAMSSNTVVMLGESLFLKGFRRVRRGVNPELEMGRFLTEVARFPQCVPVLGALEYIGNDGRTITLALVQSFVANQGDGWDFTRHYVERFLDPLRTSAQAPMPAVETHGGFLTLIATLGRRTAELHQALARRAGDPAFDPEPLLTQDLNLFRERAAEQARAALDLLRQHLPDLPAAAADLATSLLAKEAALLTRIASSGTLEIAGLKTRYHGDYHLGQVLLAGNDFVIIDFEGEPGQNIDERRAKSSPLRDVASMLRSFNRARFSALEKQATTGAERDRLDPGARAWEQAARGAFLSAYADTMAAGPSPRRIDHGLVTLFELEKALCELRYELNNRTHWATAPLQSILALIDDSPHK